MPIPYSHAQRSILTASYAQNEYLTSHEEARLARLVQLSNVQLRNYFKNKRRYDKRAREQASPTSSSDATVMELDDYNDCTAISPKLETDFDDWRELGALLDNIEPVVALDESFFIRFRQLPRFDTVQPNWDTPNFRVHGYVSALDSLSTAPRMAVWLKELCGAVGVDVPSIRLFVFDRRSGAIILDQTAHDTSLEQEWWFPKISQTGEEKNRLLGVGMDCRPDGGPITDNMRWEWAQSNESQNLGDAKTNFIKAKQRDQVLLGEGVTRDLKPAKFNEEDDIATQRTTRVQSQFGIPVVRTDGSLDGVVMLGTRHHIDDPVLNNFMSSIALSLRQSNLLDQAIN